MGHHWSGGWLRALRQAGIAGVAYVATAWLSLHGAMAGITFMPLWPPVAIAVVAVWRWGWAGLVGALLGSIVFNTVVSQIAPLLTLLIALGVAGSAGLAARVLVWTGFDPALGRVRDALVLLLSSLATLIAGANGALWIRILAPQGSWLDHVRVWSIGDALGYLVCAPALFAAHRLRDRRLPLWETVLVTASTTGAAALAFWVQPSAPGVIGPALFLVFPPLLWAALRLGGPGAAWAVLVVAVVALSGTVAGGGGSASTPVDSRQRLTAFQAFLAAMTSTFILVGAAMDEIRSVTARALAAGRMEAVGRMAGGIAHDFNNLLAVVVGTADLLRQAALDPAVQRSLDRLLAATGRCADLTRQLLAFSRGQPLEMRPLDLAALVRSSEDLLAGIAAAHPTAGAPVLLRVAAPGPCWIGGEAIHLGQVLMNLVANARDAMPGGGTVMVAVDRLPEDVACPAAQVRLTVADQGVGMDESTRVRMFEPYFTTKSQGNGLGLATVHGIVTQHAARIEVASARGAGTRIAVLFPASAAPPAEPPVVPSATVEFERVLIVDDEPEILALLTDLLDDGHREVRCAADVASAQTAIADWTPHVLVTDWRLPDGDGGGVIGALAGRGPVAVVVMTGFAAPDLVLPAGVVVMPKPFGLADLEASIALAARRRRAL